MVRVLFSSSLDFIIVWIAQGHLRIRRYWINHQNKNHCLRILSGWSFISQQPSVSRPGKCCVCVHKTWRKPCTDVAALVWTLKKLCLFFLFLKNYSQRLIIKRFKQEHVPESCLLWNHPIQTHALMLRKLDSGKCSCFLQNHPIQTHALMLERKLNSMSSDSIKAAISLLTGTSCHQINLTHLVLVEFAARHATPSVHCLTRLLVQGPGQGHWTDRSALDPNDLWTGPRLLLSGHPIPKTWHRKAVIHGNVYTMVETPPLQQENILYEGWSLGRVPFTVTY